MAKEVVVVVPRRWSVVVLVGLLVASMVATVARSDASNHRYKPKDQVPLYANKVGPFHNPRYKPHFVIRLRFFLNFVKIVANSFALCEICNIDCEKKMILF